MNNEQKISFLFFILSLLFSLLFLSFHYLFVSFHYLFPLFITSYLFSLRLSTFHCLFPLFITSLIQMGSVEQSYMRKGFLIYEEMRKYSIIFDFANDRFCISLYMRKIFYSFLLVLFHLSLPLSFFHYLFPLFITSFLFS
jgi:hypothetical protein